MIICDLPLCFRWVRIRWVMVADIGFLGPRLQVVSHLRGPQKVHWTNRRNCYGWGWTKSNKPVPPRKTVPDHLDECPNETFQRDFPGSLIQFRMVKHPRKSLFSLFLGGSPVATKIHQPGFIDWSRIHQRARQLNSPNLSCVFINVWIPDMAQMRKKNAEKVLQLHTAMSTCFYP